MAAPMSGKKVVKKGGKVCFPGRMSRRFGGKTEDCRPVAAWVESAADQNDNYDAVQSAVLIEAEILLTIEEKDLKLKHFRDDVRRRVIAKQQQKQRELLEKSYNTIQEERGRVASSTRAAENKTSRKDRCLLRKSDDLNITNGDCRNGVNCPSKCDKLTSHAEKVHIYTSQARNDLLTRKQDTPSDDLPGGHWTQKPVCVTSSERIPVPTQIGQGSSPDKRDRSRSRSTGKRRPVGMLPELYPGVVEEETRKQVQSQRAMFRRLFMDQEREQVKEMRRRREEEKHIQQIRSRAEAGRLHVESRVYVTHSPPRAQPPDHVDVTSSEDDSRREMERRVRELRVRIKERVLLSNVTLPLLCNCGAEMWDTDPDTCANNCIFYRNYTAYIKALESVLHSCT